MEFYVLFWFIFYFIFSFSILKVLEVFRRLINVV